VGDGAGERDDRAVTIHVDACERGQAHIGRQLGLDRRGQLPASLTLSLVLSAASLVLSSRDIGLPFGALALAFRHPVAMRTADKNATPIQFLIISELLFFNGRVVRPCDRERAISGATAFFCTLESTVGCEGV